jgi:hypothetical protein
MQDDMRPDPPPAILMRLLFGKQTTASLAAVAKLGIADRMGQEPVHVDELAAEAGAHSPSLYRVMRLLAALGVFREEEGHKFALTPVGELLKTDNPGSMRYTAMMLGDDWAIKAYAHMADCIRTGGDGLTMAFGKNVFDYFAEHPAQAETFHKAMTNGSTGAGRSVVAAYDFTGIKRLADVGGGHGVLIATILQRYPDMRGVLFDLPEVVDGIPEARLQECGGRLTVEAGSFFERVPEGCDAYLMKSIIHDWSDAHATRILENIRAKLPHDGRVLLCELVVTDDPGLTPAKMLDIEMLAVTVGGKERTRAEFAELFAAAGLKLNRIVTTPTAVCVIEAVPA